MMLLSVTATDTVMVLVAVGASSNTITTTTAGGMQNMHLGRGSGRRNNCWYRERAGTNNDIHTSTKETTYDVVLIIIIHVNTKLSA